MDTPRKTKEKKIKNNIGDGSMDKWEEFGRGTMEKQVRIEIRGWSMA